MATDFSKVDRMVDMAMVAGLTRLGRDVRRRAIILAPIDTGALRQSAKIEITAAGDKVAVSFNIEYAKRRHYENFLHPSTLYYLNNALKSIKSGRLGSYFKGTF